MQHAFIILFTCVFWIMKNERNQGRIQGRVLFTTTSTIAVEQAFLHFYLIWSTDLFCPPVLAFTESVISFHTFAFSAFVMTFLCFDLIMVMFFSTRKPSQPWRNVHLSVFCLLNRRFLTFFLQRILWNYGILSTV